MAHPMGESKRDGLRVDFDRRLKLEFHGSQITSDGGLLAYRELDDALGLTEVAGSIFQDSRTGKNGWHGMTGQFRQSVFGRLGGYGVIAQSGVLAPESSGDQIDVCYLNTVFELYSSYHLGQVVEAA